MRFKTVFLILTLLSLQAIGQLAQNLDWIGKLPGVGLSSSNDANGSIKRSYLVSGYLDFQQIENELVARGWRIQSKGDIAGSLQNLKATKDGWSLGISLVGSLSGGVLSVKAHSLGGVGIDSAYTAADEEEPTRAEVVEGGQAIVISGNHQTRAYTCSGNVVNVAGNHNKVTLKGSFVLNIGGNHNTVDCQGTVLPGSAVLGNHNTAQLNPSANPNKHHLQVLGNYNNVFSR